MKRLQHIVVLHDSQPQQQQKHQQQQQQQQQRQQQQQNAGHMNVWTSSTGRTHRNVWCIIATTFISATINTTYVTDQFS